ncbi:MAG TPA: EAL domain-containing protein [Dissulfurispiraceae bacterium]|nr:EAL domain-containing protein [Dissulfurispiraceae bacterium]
MPFLKDDERKIPSPTAFRKFLIIGLVLVTFVFAVLVGISINRSRLQYEEKANITTQNLSWVIEENINGIINKIDVMLMSVTEEAERQLANGGIRMKDINAYMTKQTAKTPEIQGLRMTDTKGEILYGTGVVKGVNVSDRDYFINTRDNLKSGLFISKPLFSRTSHEWSIIIARRYNYPGSSFAGEAHVAIPLQTFLKTFSNLNVGRHGNITLFNKNRDVICRFTPYEEPGSFVGMILTTPALLESLRQNQTAGMFKAVSSIDKIEKTFYFRKISSYPLYIVVGLAKVDYLADWRNDTAKTLGLSALFISIAIGFAWMIDRHISTQRKAEERLHSLAYYDTLTGLPNRFFLKDLLRRAIEYARRYNLIFAVFFIDLDNFKKINDTLGHDIGDQLLHAVSGRLQKTLRSSDFAARSSENELTSVVSRQGGDEFIILLHNLMRPQNAEGIAIRMLKELSQPYVLGDREVFMSVSIGISVYPEDGADMDNLLKNADAAMYQTKSRGKNNYQFYSKQMDVASLELLTLESDLHRALDRNELTVYYQPKATCSTKDITGVEALVRWKHPARGFISPAEFIPLAEISGLIIPIGEFVLRTACRQNKLWQESGIKPMRMAVNLSNRQFDQKDLMTMVQNALHEAQLSPQYLEVEITESTLMRDPEEAIRILRELKALGIKVAVDDFGTGYSSLNYLKQLPLDHLKIDGSFIRNVPFDGSDTAIVSSIIALAHSLKVQTIAEGVETERQLAFLQEHGCDMIQGYLLCHPLPAEDLSEILAKETLEVEN